MTSSSRKATAALGIPTGLLASGSASLPRALISHPPLIEQLGTGGKIIGPVIEKGIQNRMLFANTEKTTVRKLIAKCYMFPCREWSACRTGRCREKGLHHTPGGGETITLRAIAGAIRETYRCETALDGPLPVLKKTSHAWRGQYHATRILRDLDPPYTMPRDSSSLSSTKISMFRN